MSAAGMDKVKVLVERVRLCEAALASAKVELEAEVARIKAALSEALGPMARPGGVGGPRRAHGERIALVEPHVGKGLTDPEIAERSGVPLEGVRAARKVIERRRAQAGEANAPQAAAPATRAPAVPPPAPIALPGSDPESATLAELEEEVRRQQGGMKGKRGRILTTIASDGHRHVAELDSKGDGNTSAGGKDRHFHMVSGFVVKPAAGHRHEMTAIGADR